MYFTAIAFEMYGPLWTCQSMEVSEKTATFLVLNPLKKYAVILPKAMNYDILGHRKKDCYIPDDVLIQLILLMMSTGLLET
jgi:hypothetical protein